MRNPAENVRAFCEKRRKNKAPDRIAGFHDRMLLTSDLEALLEINAEMLTALDAILAMGDIGATNVHIVNKAFENARNAVTKARGEG